VLLVAFAVAFPVYINLYGGIRGVDARLVEAGRRSPSPTSRWA
jgi:sulfonate transport system permease protein